MDDARFVAIYREHSRKMSAFISRRAEMSDVEDLVADAFEIAWRKRNQAPVDNELGWLFTIANFVLANYQRKKIRRSRLLGLFRPEIAAPSAELVALKDFELAQAYRHLTSTEQQLIGLVYFDDLSVADAATVLKISPNAASIRLTRARAKLAAQLKGEN